MPKTDPPARTRRRVPPRWVPLAAAAGLGLATGFFLDRDRSPPAAPAPAPSPATLVAEIPLPPANVRLPVTSDPRVPARERAAPAAASPSSDAAPRPPRKLRKRATTVADAGSAARAKLQLGDESLKQGRFFEALMAFREALDQDPPVPAAARRLGDAYVAHQDTDLAVAAYERYLELEPSAPDAEEVRAAVEQLRSSTPIAH
jgi:tetratricopeptide (TPR) repeat protein